MLELASPPIYSLTSAHKPSSILSRRASRAGGTSSANSYACYGLHTAAGYRSMMKGRGVSPVHPPEMTMFALLLTESWIPTAGSANNPQLTLCVLL